MPQFEEISLGRTVRGRKSVLLLASLVFAIYFLQYPGVASTPMDTAVAGSAIQVATLPMDKVELRTPAQSTQFREGTALELPLPQGIPMTALSAVLYRLLGTVGFRLLYALLPALIACAMFLLVLKVTVRRWIALVAALVLVLNPLVLARTGLEPSFLGLFLATFLFLFLEDGPVRPVILGMSAGIFSLVQPHYILYIPLLFVWVALRSREGLQLDSSARRVATVRAVVLFGAALMLAAAPGVLLAGVWNPHAAGLVAPQPFRSGQPHLFQHALLGLPFSIRGLLNFPFHDSLVRTPGVPFPAMFMIPLLMIQSLGLLLFSLGLWGVVPALRERPREAGMHLAWILLTYLFWCFQEDWHSGREAALFLLLPSMLFFVSLGFKALTTVAGARHLVPRLAAVTVVVAVLTRFCFYLDFPQDRRWAQLHSLRERDANGLWSEVVPEREAPEDFLRNRQQMTRMSLLPSAPESLRVFSNGIRSSSSTELRREGLPENPWWNL